MLSQPTDTSEYDKFAATKMSSALPLRTVESCQISATRRRSSPPFGGDWNHVKPNGALTAKEAAAVIKEAETTIQAADFVEVTKYERFADSVLSNSLLASVRDYVYENGRRYNNFHERVYPHIFHADMDKNRLPNDDEEQDREDMKHLMLVALCGNKLHFAPLPPDPDVIVDLGTGTGIWCMEMGDVYENTLIKGIDLSPIQRTWHPSNVKFITDDISSPWVCGSDCIDYIHARQMNTAIKDTDKLLADAMKVLKPGGWIEFQDLVLEAGCDDGSKPKDYTLEKWFHLVEDTLTNKLGMTMLSPRRNEEALKRAGFVNVTVRTLKSPIGTWPKNTTLKNVGRYQRFALFQGLEAISMGVFTRGLGWSRDEVEEYLDNVRESLSDNNIHSWMPFVIIYAQKPLRDFPSTNGHSGTKQESTDQEKGTSSINRT